MTGNKQKRKTGILGGTFNPVHTGHLMIAENAYDECGLDEVWLMPAHIPPHKKSAHILDDALRLEMVRCAVAGQSYLTASDFEIRRGSVSYTSETLKALNRMYPENEFYFIMGADSLYSIEEWHHPAEIFKLANILVAARDEAGYRDLKKRAEVLGQIYHAKIHIMSVPKFEISSTMIRERVAAGRTIKYFVPEQVREFIYKNNIYQK